MANIVKQQPVHQDLLREINRARAYEVLRRTGTLSRAQLARKLTLNPTTASQLVEDLLRAGIAEEVGLGVSTGGRPPVMLRFNPNAAYAMGARMRDHEWGIIVSNLDGQIIRRIDQRIVGDSPEVAVAALVEGVQQLREQIDGKSLLPAIGIGTPGLVDIHSGVIKTAVDVGWFDVPIRQMVEDATGFRVFVANRSKVGALAEWLYGAGKGLQDLIYVSIGTGVVAGIVHAGELYVGANSSAGELGHVTVVPDGPLCPCGNRGCLQQLASGPAIVARARAALRTGKDSRLNDLVNGHPEWLGANDVLEAARQGDTLAQEVISEAATYLGIALANLVNLFNPDLIVLGGPVGSGGQTLLEPVWREMRSRAMAYPLAATRLVTSALGHDTGAIGAAALVLQQAGRLFFQA